MRIEGTDEISVKLKYGFMSPVIGDDGKQEKITEVTVRETIGEDEMAIYKQMYDTVGKKMTVLLKNCFCTGNGKEIKPELITEQLFRDMYLPDREMMFTAIYAVTHGKIPVFFDFCPNKLSEGQKPTPNDMIRVEMDFKDLKFTNVHKEHTQPKLAFPYTLKKARKFRGLEVSKVELVIPKGDLQEAIPDNASTIEIRHLICQHCVKVKKFDGDNKLLTKEEVMKLSPVDTKDIVGILFSNYWGYNTFQVADCPVCSKKHTGMFEVKSFFVE